MLETGNIQNGGGLVTRFKKDLFIGQLIQK